MRAHRHSFSPSHDIELDDRGALAKAVELLDEVHRSLHRATDDVSKRNQEMTERIRALEASASEMEQLLFRTEQQAAQLANLYVATYQLHASLDARDVRAAIADIVTNLLGAEHFSILMRDEAGQLIVDHADGRPGDSYVGGDSLIDAALAESLPQFGPIPGSEALVVVPFVAQGETLGLLVVSAFVRHKPALSVEDRELLELMGAHAASALLASRAFYVTQRKLSAYQGLLGFMRRSPT